MSTMQVLGAGWRAARQEARQQRATRAGVRTRAGQLGTVVAEHSLTILAGSCFTAAAMLVAIPLGLAVAGVALLVLELRAGE